MSYVGGPSRLRPRRGGSGGPRCRRRSPRGARSCPGRGVGVDAAELELDVLIELGEALLAGELRALRSEESLEQVRALCPCFSLMVSSLQRRVGTNMGRARPVGRAASCGRRGRSCRARPGSCSGVRRGHRSAPRSARSRPGPLAGGATAQSRLPRPPCPRAHAARHWPPEIHPTRPDSPVLGLDRDLLALPRAPAQLNRRLEQAELVGPRGEAALAAVGLELAEDCEHGVAGGLVGKVVEIPSAHMRMEPRRRLISNRAAPSSSSCRRRRAPSPALPSIAQSETQARDRHRGRRGRVGVEGVTGDPGGASTVASTVPATLVGVIQHGVRSSSSGRQDASCGLRRTAVFDQLDQGVQIIARSRAIEAAWGGAKPACSSCICGQLVEASPLSGCRASGRSR